MACDINRNTISNGIQKAATDKLVESELFNVEDEIFTPKSEYSNYKEIVDAINNAFSEKVVEKFNSEEAYTVVEPTLNLLSKYEKEAGLIDETPTPIDGTLSPEQMAKFEKLQEMGLISKDSFTHNGETLYKIPQLEGKNDEEAKSVLDEIIRKQGLNFIHIYDTGNNYVVQLGLREEISDLHPEQQASSQSSRAGQLTKKAVMKFLDKIGFTNIQTVSSLVYKGHKISTEGYIDFGEGVMKIKEGREDYTLPEESMHILVKLIQNSRPDLYNRLTSEVINYNLYRDVVNDPAYKNPEYQNDDGSLNYEKIKEEAAAKLLAEYLINKLEKTQESARAIERAYNLWQAVIQWIKDVFGIYKNPFKEAIDLMDKDLGEFDDINSDEVFFSAKPLEEVDSLNPENKQTFEAIENKPEELNIHKEESNYYKDGVRVTYSRADLEAMSPVELAKVATDLKIQGVTATQRKEDAIKTIMANKPSRVTDLSDTFYSKLFGKRNFDAALEAFYDQSRRDGSYIHEIFEATINSYIDRETGLLKAKPSELEFPLTTPLQRKMGRKIDIFVRNLLGDYDQGTRFLVEQVIYDPVKNRYGTIDLMAILPDKEGKGKTVDILDWKTMLLQNLESTRDYKKEGIAIQLNEYKRILKEAYGIQNVRRLRAIPLRKQYEKDTNGNNVLKDIQLGNADAAKVSERYLRHIISPEESTGSLEKDQVVAKLNWLYKKYVERGKFKDDRTVLDEIEDAIYEIRTSNSIEGLSRYFADIVGKIRQTVSEGEKSIPTLSKDEANNMLANISFYESIIDFLSPTVLTLQKDTSVDEKERNALFRTISELNLAKTNLYNTPESPGLREKLMDHLAQKEGIFDLLKPEKVVNLMTRFFRSMGSQDMATVRYLYALTKKSYNRISLKTDGDLKNLKNLKNDFETWRKSNNLSEKDAIGKLVNYEKGTLYSRLDQSFYDERTRVFETRDGKQILEFIKANYDLTEYDKWYKETLAQKKSEWDNSTFDEDPGKNRRIIRGRIKDFETNYNIYTHAVTAFGSHNVKVWSRNMFIDKWESKNYKEMSKKGNEALLNLYNYMVQKNQELADTGAIEDYEIHKFFPNVRKTYADSLTFDEVSVMKKTGNILARQYSNYRNSLTVGDYQYNYQGARDETGKKIERRFLPYVAKIDNEYEIKVKAAVSLGIIQDSNDTQNLDERISKWRATSAANNEVFAKTIRENRNMSFDIFKIYGMMAKEVNREQYLQENDEIARTLLHIEKNKQSLLQNKYGTLAETEGGDSIKLSEERGRNIKILEEHLRHIVAGESLQTDSDFVINFSLKLKDRWNKSRLGKLYQFKSDPAYNPKGISATKFVLWLSTANQKRILGVNLSSALANLFGGTFSAGKLYSKYVTPEDIKRGWQKMTSVAFYQNEEMKKNAALVDYFLPLLDNREHFQTTQLSVSKASRILSQEWLMAPMRKTSEVVQLNIFFGILENTGLVDGRIVNLREKAAQDTDYHNRYRMSAEQRDAKEKEFNDKVKEYKEKYSLVKQATFKKVKMAGKDETVVEIPGVDRNSDDVMKLRDIVQTMSKDSLGETDEYDLANYKYSLFWRLMMTFKNWIPRTFDVRFGEFRYSQSHEAYEYGRVRMLWRAISANYLQTIVKLAPIPFWGKATNAFFTKDAVIKRALEVYEQKKSIAKKLGRYDERTFITEGEFVERFVKGTEASFAELRTLIFMSAILMAGLAAPDDDDDSETKAFKNLMARQIDKLRDEVGFFYSPKSGIDIAGGGPPIVSLIKDSYNLVEDTSRQFFGFSLSELGYDEKGEALMEKAKPAKRIFKMFPFTNQVISYLPAVDDETAKEWGLRISPQKVLY